jgi:hypothetical protein
MFAWCVQTLAGASPIDAESAALSFYPYEPSSDGYRGLVFHDEAWHWAMRQIIGEHYWVTRPELEQPSAAYLQESQAFLPPLGT